MMTAPANEIEARIRQLEKDHVAMSVQHDAIRDQQLASRDELKNITKEMRDEFKVLRTALVDGQQATMQAINANKLAWSMMNSGTKVAAWIILALTSIVGAVAGVVAAIKRVMS